MPGMIGSPCLVAFGISAALDWFGVATGRKKIEYVFKPLTMLVLLYAVISSKLVSSVEGPLVWLCIALILSLLGDVFLMLPRDLFLPGLASFFLAHVAYIASFLPYASFSARWIVPALVVAAIAVRYGTQIVTAIERRGKTSLKMPVIAYMVVITAMVGTVLATDSTWAYLGAVLFLASDTMIGLSRFVRAFTRDRLAIMVTYHLGQLGLVAGALHLYVGS